MTALKPRETLTEQVSASLNLSATARDDGR